MPLSHVPYSLLAWWMARRNQPDTIRGTVRSMPFRHAALEAIDPQSIQVAVVQEKIRIMPNYQTYAKRMLGFLQTAVDQGAQLVCFPEENGTLLLGLVPLLRPGLSLASHFLKGQTTGSTPQPGIEMTRKEAHLDIRVAERQPGIPALTSLLTSISPILQKTFETIFSELARGFGVYIMAGSIMLVEEGRLVNRAYLFNPQGDVVGTQDKAHPTELEMGLGLSCASELRVFDTALGPLAFPVCMDATYFETFKILKQMGARMVIIPIANQEEYEEPLALRGIWPRVQESGVYGLKSALVGDLFGMRFTGKAGVYAPIALTPDRSGVVAEAGSYDQDEVISATIDPTRLENSSSDYFSDTNPALYRKYFPGIYNSLVEHSS